MCVCENIKKATQLQAENVCKQQLHILQGEEYQR